MATLTREIAVLKNTGVHAGWYEKVIDYLQGCYFGIVAMTIAVSGIFGGVSVMYILKNDAPLWQLAVSVILVLSVNIWAVLATHIKWVINFFIVSIIINSCLIIANFSPIAY